MDWGEEMMEFLKTIRVIVCVLCVANIIKVLMVGDWLGSLGWIVAFLGWLNLAVISYFDGD